MHILVVDDQAAARQFFEEILKNWGHTVYLAENGSQAWKMLLSTSIDMVVTDWMMPEINGLETFKRIWNCIHTRKPQLQAATQRQR